MGKWLERISGKELKLFSIFSVVLLFMATVIVTFATGNPMELIEGMKLIVISRDALITDYFELAGYGTAFLNTALVLGISILLVISQKIPFTGPTMAALFINAGYGLWGKNPVNIIPVILGTALYAKMHKSKLSRYIYTALFGTCLAPLLTELAYLFPFSWPVNILLAVMAGILIGFVLPPLSMHTASMHMGYNLFNVGFSGGILAFAVVCLLRSFGMESESVLVWKEGQNQIVGIGLFLYFMSAIVFGFFISGRKIDGLKSILKHPGRAVADFVLMDGAGPTLMNMGLVGILCEGYILLTGGDFSGPVVGAILAVFGFSAFGVHVKNYFPVMAGVYISTFFTVFSPNTPSIQLAAIFAAGLSPIAGQFGVVAGMLAGFLHAAVVVCTTPMYGGLNLYNNGFSAGWVAVIMVPVIESFMKHFKERKREK
ncbi:MAG: DUF1576 domain-containing protein [Kineothrix sp.]|nr:DUF1576 domain-containing protein [Kineothrix sp.]